jgi:UDP-N-acetylmuramyl pentapeptide phosphotransferase/UDP-N-acetylglucosamine-1-phosphate transferase
MSVALALLLMLRFDKAGKLDLPNNRSLHRKPVPRSGGVALLLAFVTGFWASDWSISLWLAVGLIAAVSWFDDQFVVPVLVRLSIHFIAAGLALHSTGFAASEVLLQLFVLVGIVWCSNLYNFMDGSDGLAGGMALFGFLVLAAAAKAAGADDVAIFCLCVSAGTFGFLLFNFQPARIFLGDIGSVTLGFVFSIVCIVGIARQIWPWWFPLVVFSPFVIDATVTLFARLLRGKNVFQAHDDHYYQRLIRMGWSHRQLALVEYFVMVSVAVIALIALRLGGEGQSLLLTFVAGSYFIFARLIDRRWSQFVQRPVVGKQP